MRNKVHPNHKGPPLHKNLFKDGCTEYIFFKNYMNLKSDTTLLFAKPAATLLKLPHLCSDYSMTSQIVATKVRLSCVHPILKPHQ